MPQDIVEELVSALSRPIIPPISDRFEGLSREVNITGTPAARVVSKLKSHCPDGLPLDSARSRSFSCVFGHRFLPTEDG